MLGLTFQQAGSQTYVSACQHGGNTPLAVGDVIHVINGSAVGGPDHAGGLLRAAVGEIRVLISRQGSPTTSTRDTHADL